MILPHIYSGYVYNTSVRLGNAEPVLPTRMLLFYVNVIPEKSLTHIKGKRLEFLHNIALVSTF